MLQRTHRQRGFTLLEVMVACAVIGIVAAFSLPSLASGIRAASLSSATRAATNHVRRVRATAVARHVRARLAVTSGNRLGIETFDGSWTRLPTGIVLDGGVTVASVTPGGGIVFESDGTSSAAGTVRLRNSRGDERAISVAILGAVDAP
ncbi:MAG: pilus assembly FimT family protein [Candidatus Binatia bacterium]